MALKQRKYIKKVIVSDDLSTPEARAERLRRIRNMANLSRQEMCNSNDLNINTYKGWEIARYGGLPVDGAEKVLRLVAQKGVICSLDWLLHGQGQGPYSIPPPESSLFDNQRRIKVTNARDTLVKEIMLFQSYYPEAIYMEVQDDCMAPLFEKEDFIAGVKKYGEDLNFLSGENCIVQPASGNLVVRCLRQSGNKNRFSLTCLNPKAQIDDPIIYDVEIEFAALVSRHYKLIKD